MEASHPLRRIRRRRRCRSASREGTRCRIQFPYRMSRWCSVAPQLRISGHRRSTAWCARRNSPNGPRVPGGNVGWRHCEPRLGPPHRANCRRMGTSGGGSPPWFSWCFGVYETSSSVDNMNASVSGGESLNRGAESGRDFLEIDVFDGTKSVRTQNGSNARGLETAVRTFSHFLQLFGPLFIDLP